MMMASFGRQHRDKKSCPPSRVTPESQLAASVGNKSLSPRFQVTRRFLFPTEETWSAQDPTKTQRRPR